MFYFSKTSNAVYDDEQHAALVLLEILSADTVEVPNTMYSPSRRGFYSPAMYAAYVDAASWPDDVYPVDATEEVALRAILDAPPPLTNEQQIANNVAQKTYCLNLSNTQISILTDAVDPEVVDEVTPADVALLLLWKKYRQLLRNINTSILPVVWPVQPELAYTQREENEV